MGFGESTTDSQRDGSHDTFAEYPRLRHLRKRRLRDVPRTALGRNCAIGGGIVVRLLRVVQRPSTTPQIGEEPLFL